MKELKITEEAEPNEEEENRGKKRRNMWLPEEVEESIEGNSTEAVDKEEGLTEK